MNTLQQLITEELTTRRLSYRKAAREIGIAHTTLIRIIAGEPCDMPTVQKIATWLNVSPSALVDSMGNGNEHQEVINAIVAVISAEPELEYVFLEAGNRLQNGTMSPEEFRELVRYAAFRFNIKMETIDNVNRQTARGRAAAT